MASRYEGGTEIPAVDQARQRSYCWYGGSEEEGGPLAFSIRNALSAIASHVSDRAECKRKSNRPGDSSALPSICAAALYDKVRLVATHRIERVEDAVRQNHRPPLLHPLQLLPSAELLASLWYGKWGDLLRHGDDDGECGFFDPGAFLMSIPLRALGGAQVGFLLLAISRSGPIKEKEKTCSSWPRSVLQNEWVRVLTGLMVAWHTKRHGDDAAPSALATTPACDLVEMTKGAKYFYPIEVGDSVGAEVDAASAAVLPGRAVGDRERIVRGIRALSVLTGLGANSVTLRGTEKELQFHFKGSDPSSATLTLALPMLPAPAPPPPSPPPPARAPAEAPSQQPPPLSVVLSLSSPVLGTASFAANSQTLGPRASTGDSTDGVSTCACHARYILDAKRGRQRPKGGRAGEKEEKSLLLRRRRGGGNNNKGVGVVAIYHPDEAVRAAAAAAAEGRGCVPMVLAGLPDARRVIKSGTRGLVAVLADDDSLPRLRRSVERAGLSSNVRVAAIPHPKTALSSLLPSFECAVADALGLERRRIQRILVACRDANVLGAMLDRALAASAPSGHDPATTQLSDTAPIAVVTHQPRDMEVMPSAVVAREYDVIFSELPEDPISGERQCREKGMEFANRIRALAKSPTDAPVLVAIIDRKEKKKPPPSEASLRSHSSSSYSSSSSSSSGGVSEEDGVPLTAMFDYVLQRPFNQTRVRDVVLSAERALLRRRLR